MKFKWWMLPAAVLPVAYFLDISQLLVLLAWSITALVACYFLDWWFTR